jgi:hypothetical protein
MRHELVVGRQQALQLACFINNLALKNKRHFLNNFNYEGFYWINQLLNNHDDTDDNAGYVFLSFFPIFYFLAKRFLHKAKLTTGLGGGWILIILATVFLHSK